MTAPVEVVQALNWKKVDILEIGLTDSTMIVKNAK